MAHSAKPLSFLFLILISTSLRAEARERLFFSKVTHTTTTPTNNAIISEPPEFAPSPSPSLSPSPAPAATEVKPSETGYGLYGQKSDEFLPTKKTTAVFPDEGSEFQDEELSENYEKGETGYTYNNNNNNNGYSNNQNSYNANGYANNYNGGSGYVSEKQGTGYTYNNNNNNNNGYSNNQNSYNANGYANNYNGGSGYVSEKQGTGYTYNNNNNNGYSNNQNSYNGNGYANNYNGGTGYVSERQGMSDTRFMENGKYSYSPKSENNHYSALYDSGNGKSEGYDNGNGENEFDSMEEYEKQQGYYPQSQGGYVP